MKVSNFSFKDREDSHMTISYKGTPSLNLTVRNSKRTVFILVKMKGKKKKRKEAYFEAEVFFKQLFHPPFKFRDTGL
jgi:hypothetical protein